MKKIILLFLVLASLTEVQAQMQQVQFDWNIVSSDLKMNNSFSLSYFRPNKLDRGTAFRLTYLTTRSQENINNPQIDILQIDVTERWYHDLKSRIKIFTELGVSGMFLNKDGFYDYYGRINFINSPISCFDCDYLKPGSLFESSEYGIDYKLINKNYELSIYPGGTGAGGIEVEVVKSFYVGFLLRVNAYYILEKKEGLTYLYYGIYTGYQF